MSKMKRNAGVYFFYCVVLAPFLPKLINDYSEGYDWYHWIMLLSVGIILAIIIRLIIYPNYVIITDSTMIIHKELFQTYHIKLREIERVEKSAKWGSMISLYLSSGKRIQINISYISNINRKKLFETLYFGADLPNKQ